MNDGQDLRLIAFLSIISLVILWELFQPKRPLSQNKTKRWFNNITLVALDSLIVRLLLPLGAVGIAVWASEKQLGLFNIIELDC